MDAQFNSLGLYNLYRITSKFKIIKFTKLFDELGIIRWVLYASGAPGLEYLVLITRS